MAPDDAKQPGVIKLAAKVISVTALALAMPHPHAFAQGKVVTAVAEEIKEFSIAQLDAMLAPIALYPDELLTQTLMAATFPLQVVAAARWLEKDNNKTLEGELLVKTLESKNWDPSVKSLIPFPQVLVVMNDHLEWLQQLGYAMANQQAAVFSSIQRLRRQAHIADSLKTTEQQRVVVKEETVIIEPANPETVYVPVYQPENVYGEWPYPSTPPVYLAPPADYYPAAYAPGYVWGRTLAFAAGAAVVGRLWGWARPRWGYGNVSVNPLRYNSINVNRSASGSRASIGGASIQNGTWRAGAAGPAGRSLRPPGGPVGAATRMGQLPTNAIGRGAVQVPGGAVNRPQIPSTGSSAGAARADGAGLGGVGGIQSAGAARGQLGQASALRGSAGQRPAQMQARARSPTVLRGSGGNTLRSAGAFGGVGDGGRARNYSARGAQSRGFQQSAISRSGGYGGGQHAGGRGYRGGGGGGFRGGGRR
jgi:Protein of unknown function (DUF3300)